MLPLHLQKVFNCVKQLLLSFTVIFLSLFAAAQQPDTLAGKDSIQPSVVQTPVNSYETAWLQQNKYLNITGNPVAMPVKFRPKPVGDVFFYFLLLLVLLLALLRFFYSRYFNTLFRVFFNTSLRQSQLTDQLLQAKLPSLLFNVFFVLSTGSYIYFLLQHYKVIDGYQQWFFWWLSIVAVAVIYFTKYSTLKFTGWITGYTQTTDTYVFVIFLISKIIGVVLLPFTILMAFANINIAAVAALLSLLFAGLLLLLRFFRSYGLLQNQLKISRFHFILYLAGVEIIPLLLIYKGLVLLLQKNL
jgi:Domain of unknown function (DUF4271)